MQSCRGKVIGLYSSIVVFNTKLAGSRDLGIRRLLDAIKNVGNDEKLVKMFNLDHKHYKSSFYWPCILATPTHYQYVQSAHSQAQYRVRVVKVHVEPDLHVHV